MSSFLPSGGTPGGTQDQDAEFAKTTVAAAAALVAFATYRIFSGDVQKELNNFSEIMDQSTSLYRTIENLAWTISNIGTLLPIPAVGDVVVAAAINLVFQRNLDTLPKEWIPVISPDEIIGKSNAQIFVLAAGKAINAYDRYSSSLAKQVSRIKYSS